MKRTTLLNFLLGRDDPITLTNREKRKVARSQINEMTGSSYVPLGWKVWLGITIILTLLILWQIFFPYGVSSGPGLFDNNNYGPLEMGPQGVE